MSTYTYEKIGISTEKQDAAMKLILPLFQETLKNRKNKVGESRPASGHYAAFMNVTKDITVALTTDGVGTKTFIAQDMEKYDTIGIDCIAMNVNDIICTGAEPTSFLDYLAIQKANPELINEIAKGLKKGADISNISIVGGETAILPEMIGGTRPDCGFDLAGMCLGVIDPQNIIDGSRIEDGDIIIGISSSGIHSNGLTLARKSLLGTDKFNVNTFNEKLGRTIGEELLEPTSIYVDEIMELIKSGINLKLVSHITSNGLFNLGRFGKNVSYKISYLPTPQPIFKLIQEHGKILSEEMYFVYNMGVGMCIVVPKSESESTIKIIEKFGKNVFVMGEVIDDDKRNIEIKTENLKMSGSFKEKIFQKS